LFLLDAVENTSSVTFLVNGTNDDIYKVTFGNSMSCTCPDCTFRRRICKHLYFVIKKVLHAGVIEESFLCDKPLSAAVAEYLSVRKSVSVPKEATSKQEDVQNISKEAFKPICAGTECGICREEFTFTDQVVTCRYRCGNHFHHFCMSRYKSDKTTISCPYCRAPWDFSFNVCLKGSTIMQSSPVTDTTVQPPVQVDLVGKDYSPQQVQQYYASRGDPELTAEEVETLRREHETGSFSSPSWLRSAYL